MGPIPFGPLIDFLFLAAIEGGGILVALGALAALAHVSGGKEKKWWTGFFLTTALVFALGILVCFCGFTALEPSWANYVDKADHWALAQAAIAVSLLAAVAISWHLAKRGSVEPLGLDRWYWPALMIAATAVYFKVTQSNPDALLGAWMPAVVIGVVALVVGLLGRAPGIRKFPLPLAVAIGVPVVWISAVGLANSSRGTLDLGRLQAFEAVVPLENGNLSLVGRFRSSKWDVLSKDTYWLPLIFDARTGRLEKAFDSSDIFKLSWNGTLARCERQTTLSLLGGYRGTDGFLALETPAFVALARGSHRVSESPAGQLVMTEPGPTLDPPRLAFRPRGGDLVSVPAPDLPWHLYKSFEPELGVLAATDEAAEASGPPAACVLRPATKQIVKVPALQKGSSALAASEDGLAVLWKLVSGEGENPFVRLRIERENQRPVDCGVYPAAELERAWLVGPAADVAVLVKTPGGSALRLLGADGKLLSTTPVAGGVALAESPEPVPWSDSPFRGYVNPKGTHLLLYDSRNHRVTVDPFPPGDGPRASLAGTSFYFVSGNQMRVRDLSTGKEERLFPR